MGADAVNCTIAVDTMGGDRGPTEFIRGLSHAFEKFGLTANFVLVGNGRLLERLVKVRRLDRASGRISIHHAGEVIGMKEKPVQAIKTKKDASMVRAVELLRNGEANAVVSCGNTGALMALGTLRMRPLPGVSRPALASVVPSRGKPFVLLDVGANPESTAENLTHNAILGANYAKAALGIARPRVALLTIGTEEGKGTTVINRTHEQLRKLDGILHYAGPIEGFQLFEGTVDVVVCDGFVGNVVLKSSEALFGFVGDTIRQELVRNPKRKIGAALSSSAFKAMKARLSPDHHAGAPLLGLRGNLLKSHGSSNSLALANALRIAGELVRHDMIDAISGDIAEANRLMQDTEPVGSAG